MDGMAELARKLKTQIAADEGRDTLVPYLGGKNRVERLLKCFDSIVENFQSGTWNEMLLYQILERYGNIRGKEEVMSTEILVLLNRLEKLLANLKLVGEDEFDQMNCIREAVDISDELFDCMEKLKTCSTAKEEVIAREKDIEAIKERFPDSDKGVSVIVIAGEHGIGKTTVAKCLYDDKDFVNNNFIRCWMSVSHFLPSGEDKNLSKGYPGDLVNIVGYWSIFLVLDGISTVEQMKQLDKDLFKRLNRMKNLYGLCNKFYIVITTTLVEDQLKHSCEIVSSYTLEGLSEDKSFTMFKSIALASDELEEQERAGIIESGIGLKICKECENNPCVIKTVASILSYKHTLEEWKQFQHNVCPSIETPMKAIKSKVNLHSFRNLPFALKRCLIYCWSFPKDYEFYKADLIRHWLATGFMLKSLDNEDKAEELVGDEHFEELHQKGYFCKYSKIESDVVCYKMLYFTDELVKYVARDYGCHLVHKPAQQIDPQKIQHVCFIINSSWHTPSWLLKANKLRSLLFQSDTCDFITMSHITEILSSLKFLETLDIVNMNCESLPSVIGDLKLLRSLRLGATSEILPECLTALHNLRLLDLRQSSVRTLTKGFLKLQNLRYLYPSNMLFDDKLPTCGELFSLQSSDLFIVGQNVAQNALVDYSCIAEEQLILYGQCQEEKGLQEMSSILKDDKLCDILLMWSPSRRESTTNDKEEHDNVVKCLLSPPTLKSIAVRCWNGISCSLLLFPNSLVRVEIVDCRRCQHLPSFSTLPFLKSLQLWGLNALKYMEKGDGGGNETTYFPSLKSLMLANLPKMKAWSNSLQPRLIPLLSELRVSGCPELISMPFVPKLESLEANDIPMALLQHILHAYESTTSSSTSTSSASVSMIKKLQIASVDGLVSLSIHLPSLESLTIKQCGELINLVIKSPTTLHRLEIHECSRLKDISSALQHLSDLKEIEIERCEVLDWDIKSVDEVCSVLRFLKLTSISTDELPDGIGYLTSLEELSLNWLYNLRVLPEWIGGFTRLQRLSLRHCPNLTTLPESVGNLSTIQQLKIRSCPRLKKLPECFRNHESLKLEIQECPRLERLLQ